MHPAGPSRITLLVETLCVGMCGVYPSYRGSHTARWCRCTMLCGVQVLHFIQLYLTGRCQLFDYGSEEANVAVYQQRTPPVVSDSYHMLRCGLAGCVLAGLSVTHCDMLLPGVALGWRADGFCKRVAMSHAVLQGRSCAPCCWRA